MLKSESLQLNEWIDALAADLAAEARTPTGAPGYNAMISHSPHGAMAPQGTDADLPRSETYAQYQKGERPGGNSGAIQLPGHREETADQQQQNPFEGVHARKA